MKTNTSTILAFASHDTYQMVLPCTIAYLASAGNYVRIHRTKGPDVLVSKNLKAIESILPPDMFVRIHKQYVVNIYQIDKYVKSESAIALQNGEKLPVAVRRRKSLLDCFQCS